HPGEHQVADGGGERGGAVGLLCETDRDTDGEQQRQVVEEGAAGGADDLGRGGQRRDRAEQVVLAQPEQDGRGGQHCDRQHQAPAEALQHSQPSVVPAVRCGGSGAHVNLLLSGSGPDWLCRSSWIVTWYLSFRHQEVVSSTGRCAVQVTRCTTSTGLPGSTSSNWLVVAQARSAATVWVPPTNCTPYTWSSRP